MTTEIIVKETGERKTAIYAPNSSGNMRYNVDGKFYTDKKFNQLFTIESKDISHLWQCHVKNLFTEIVECNDNMWIMSAPLKILYGILQNAAQRAIEIQDKELIKIFCRLAMYKESDPTDKENYDAEKMKSLINES